MQLVTLADTLTNRMCDLSLHYFIATVRLQYTEAASILSHVLGMVGDIKRTITVHMISQ